MLGVQVALLLWVNVRWKELGSVQWSALVNVR
jgi:hypothetical protein